MGESGVVVAVESDNVKVSMIRTEACAKCRACTYGMAQEEMVITAKNACGAKIGDRVNIELNDSSFLSAVLIMYGMPLLMLMLGFLAASAVTKLMNIANDELISFFIGIVMLVLSYIAISRWEGSFKDKKYEPIATKSLEP